MLLHRQSTHPAHCLLALLLMGGLCAVSGKSTCTPESGRFWAEERSMSKPIVFPPPPESTGSTATDLVWTFNFSHECTLLLENIEFSFKGACTFQLHNIDYSWVGLNNTFVQISGPVKSSTINVNERTATVMGQPKDTNDGSRYFTVTAKGNENTECAVESLVLRTEDVDECNSTQQSGTLCPSNKTCVNMIGTYGCCSRDRDHDYPDDSQLVTHNGHYRPCTSQTTAFSTETRPTTSTSRAWTTGKNDIHGTTGKNDIHRTTRKNDIHGTIGTNDTHVTSAIALTTNDAIAFGHQHTIAAIAISCSSLALFVIVLLAIWQRGYLSNSATGFV
ncbi:uncharacterized protein LOC135812551 [Sycon ciliatum]|uniref:uncharacterized protein LOC135812551 n=1 Tax=Sycon ciliatum TaxID=27933 RepID=UPI0031F6B6BE